MASFSLTISADSVAWYGAIVATFSLLLGYLQMSRDRARIKVKVKEGLLFPRNILGSGTKIIVEAVNVGRRPITLNGCALKFSNGKSLILPNPTHLRFPYELNEGKAISIFFDKTEVLNTLREDKTRVVAAMYYDSAGRCFSKKWKLAPQNLDPRFNE